VTFGPNAQMTFLSKMTPNNTSNYYGFKEDFCRPTKTAKGVSVTKFFTSDTNKSYLCKIISKKPPIY